MKRYIFITILFYLVFLTFVSYRVSKAYFTDMAVASSNTFTAASEFPTPTGTEPQTANHLVISEVQINGANANQDFVEIYNPTDNAVDITGWKLRVRNSAGTESSLAVIPTATVSAHGFHLWANNQNEYSTSIGADIANGNNIAPNNSVALLTNTDILVDSLAWGNSTNPFVENLPFADNPSDGGSLERKALSTADAPSMNSGGVDEFKGNGFDSDNNATDFILRTISQPQNSSSASEQP